jgi:hypothetical protein
MMTELDIVHAAARELAEQIATRLARLEPEAEILPQIDRLRGLELPIGCVCSPKNEQHAHREVNRDLRLTCSELRSRKTIRVSQAELRQRRLF